jgi:predicted lipoprotein with Yx(FWY)xxD motif
LAIIATVAMPGRHTASVAVVYAATARAFFNRRQNMTAQVPRATAAALMMFIALAACRDKETEVEVSAGTVGDTPVVTAEIDPPAGPPVTISVAETEGGVFLTDGAGNAIYVAETSTTTPSEGFRPLTGRAIPGSAQVQASLIGVTTLPDGTLQVTYAGQPLYTYAEDRAPGDTKGAGKTAGGTRYHLVDPAGKETAAKAR